MRSLWTTDRRWPIREGWGHDIEGGQVACPIRGVVDLERCFMCPGFDGLREGTPERLMCRPDRDAAGWKLAEETWALE